MRQLLGLMLIAFTMQNSIALEAKAECGCLKHARDEEKRSAALEALRHLPSQSDLVTARTFAGQKMQIDAANMYVAAAQKVEQELEDGKQNKLPAAAAIPVDAVSYLTERAISIQGEAAQYLEQSGKESRQALAIKEMAFGHMLDFGDFETQEKARIAKQLATSFAQTGDSVKARKYCEIALEVLRRTKGRYSPDVIALQQDFGKLLSHSPNKAN